MKTTVDTPRRIFTARPNFGRIEILVDGEWCPVTQFMDYGICEEYMKVMREV